MTQTQTQDMTTTALGQTPMRTLLLQNLATQTASISHLFTALASPAPNPAGVQTSYALLGTSTDELAAVLREAERHQEAWGRVMRQRKAVEDLERRVRGLCRDLERGSRELGMMVDESRSVLKGGECGMSLVHVLINTPWTGLIAVPLNVPTLLAHAQALAKTSSAPTSTLLTPADKAQSLPWPSEASMRMGLLFQTQGSMTQGETGTLGDGKSTSLAPWVVGLTMQRYPSLHQRSTCRSTSRNNTHTKREGSTTRTQCTTWTSIQTRTTVDAAQEQQQHMHHLRSTRDIRRSV